jgi:hypothetical protein
VDRPRGERSHSGSDLGKRYGVLAVVCFAVLAAPAAAQAGPADVAALQVALRLHGVHTGAIDGVFGPETRGAVRRFQRRHRLVADGVPGPRTIAALGPFARHRLGKRPMRLGMVGWDVAALQYLLTRCELTVGGIDGTYGQWTRAAVRHYQRLTSLREDGVAGPATVAGLRRAHGCPRVEGTIPRGVTISGLRVAGLSGEEADTALRSAFARPLQLRARGRTFFADPYWLAHPAVLAAVRRALHARPGAHLHLRVKPRTNLVRGYSTTIDGRVCRPPVDARLLGLRSLRPNISRARVGCRVRRAELVNALVSRLGGLDRSALRVPIERIRPTVTRASFGPIIVVRRGSHDLDLYRGQRLVRVVPVGTGKASTPTPLGRFTIVVKIRHPWWYPPASSWAEGLEPIPPGPGNPLGTRWMGLSASGIGIHGTPDAASVGYSRSHGCIRMFPREAAWLFRRVRIGTPVFIVGA